MRLFQRRGSPHDNRLEQCTPAIFTRSQAVDCTSGKIAQAVPSAARIPHLHSLPMATPAPSIRTIRAPCATHPCPVRRASGIVLKIRLVRHEISQRLPMQTPPWTLLFRAFRSRHSPCACVIHALALLRSLLLPPRAHTNPSTPLPPRRARSLVSSFTHMSPSSSLSQLYAPRSGG